MKSLEWGQTRHTIPWCLSLITKSAEKKLHLNKSFLSKLSLHETQHRLVKAKFLVVISLRKQTFSRMPVKGRPTPHTRLILLELSTQHLPQGGGPVTVWDEVTISTTALHLHYGSCTWRNLLESSHPPTDQQCSLSPQNSHSKELPGHSSVCLLAESGISEYLQAN